MSTTSPIPFGFRHVILQPTTRCNLNCSYCYLPDRSQRLAMSVSVAEAVASSLSEVPHELRVLWHGGEPLAVGLKTFRQLLAPFSNLVTLGKVRHSLQTNATLITPAWCELFHEFRINVGVSLDGTELHNAGRITWANRPAYAHIQKGLELLNRNGIDFGIIAVVNAHNVGNPEGFYESFITTGCTSLNINVEEREGYNRNSRDLPLDKVKEFWRRLFEAWLCNPVMKIREFENALGWMEGICSGQGGAIEQHPKDMWPTVAFNGDVVVISPEFVSGTLEERGAFVVGNVLKSPLPEIVLRSKDAWYVHQFFEGRDECRKSCRYFSFCGGGQASNKFFETGRLNVAETTHCRNARQSVIDAVIQTLTNGN